MLKRDKKKGDKKDDITIEELVEIERANLGYNLAKITLESFLEWKKKKISEKQTTARKESDRKKAEFKAGKNTGLSGREMFTFNPELARDNDMDDGEAAMDIIREEGEEGDDSGPVKEIDIDSIANLAQEVDQSGTQCTEMKRNFAQSKASTDQAQTSSKTDDAGEPTTSEAVLNGDVDEEDINDEPIDETLFAEDDLDDLEDELNSATLN